MNEENNELTVICKSELDPNSVYYHMYIQGNLHPNLSAGYAVKWGKYHKDAHKSELIYCPDCKSNIQYVNFLSNTSGRLYCLSCITEFLIMNEYQLNFCKLEKVPDDKS